MTFQTSREVGFVKLTSYSLSMCNALMTTTDCETMMRVNQKWMRSVGLFLIVAVALSATSCSDPEPEFTAWERPDEGQWYRGDLHVHAAGASNDASEESTPEKIREVAIERGLDFVVLTDHSNSTGSDPSTRDEDPDLFNQGPEFPFWNDVAELSDESLLMVQGNEVSPVDEGESDPRGHTGCIPATLGDDFDPDVAFVDRPRGEITGGQGLEQALDAGCFAILNHPFGPVPWISYDWTSYDYDAVEVWNGGLGFNQFDESALKSWACDLSQDRRVVPIGASDNHKIEVELPGTQTDPALGRPTTWVFAPELDWDEIIDGLNGGAVSITDSGYPLEIDVFDADGEWQAMAGGEFDVDAERWIRLQGRRVDGTGKRSLQLMKISRGECDDLRSEGETDVPEPNWEVVEQWEIDEGEIFDERLAVDAESGDIYFGWMKPENYRYDVDDVAISGALFTK